MTVEALSTDFMCNFVGVRLSGAGMWLSSGAFSESSDSRVERTSVACCSKGLLRLDIGYRFVVQNPGHDPRGCPRGDRGV